jgi:hypothetical protein
LVAIASGIAPASMVQPAEIALIALVLIGLALSANHADFRHSIRTVGRQRWALIGIPLWIAAQTLPLPLGLAHPIWRSLSDALPSHKFGLITADLMATLNALVWSIALVALLFATTLAARDRLRSQNLLFVLTGALGLFALAVVVISLFDPARFLGGQADLAICLCGFGLFLGIAVIELAIERRETRHSLRPSLLTALGGSLAGVACGAVLLIHGNAQIAVITGIAAGVLVMSQLIRRFDLTVLPATALAFSLSVSALVAALWLFEKGPQDAPLLLRFAPDVLREHISLLSQLSGDSRLLGTGAGTFETVAKVYQRVGDAPIIKPSSAAFALQIEIGWIGVAALLALAVSICVRLFQGGLLRGRDSFFALAAATCLSFAITNTFVGNAMIQLPALIVLTIILGIGLSQSIGQAAR